MTKTSGIMKKLDATNVTKNSSFDSGDLDITVKVHEL